MFHNFTDDVLTVTPQGCGPLCVNQAKSCALLSPPGTIFLIASADSRICPIERKVTTESSQHFLVFREVAEGTPLSVRASLPPAAYRLGDGAPVDPKACEWMLECYASGPGAPLPHPAAPLLASAAPSGGAQRADVVLLSLARGALSNGNALAYVCKTISRHTQRALEEVYLVDDCADMKDELKPWLLYLSPLVTYAVVSIGDVESVVSSAKCTGACALVICQTRYFESVARLLRLDQQEPLPLPDDAGLVALQDKKLHEPVTMAGVRPGTSELLQFHPISNRVRDGDGWHRMGEWEEVHCPTTCGCSPDATVVSEIPDTVAGCTADTRGSGCRLRHLKRWPFDGCAGLHQLDAASDDGNPPKNRAGEGFDGSQVFSAFYSQWAPSSAPSISRPLCMHGVWSPRCERADVRGTVILCNGCTIVDRRPGGHMAEHEGANFGPQCLFSALLGFTPPVEPGRSGYRADAEPLPASISGFQCSHPYLRHPFIYQAPAGVLLLAAAIESIIGLGYGPVVLLGHSLGGAVVVETASRLLEDLSEGWLGGVCMLAPQGVGLHCDNKHGVDSMKLACERLGRAGKPLAVYHGTGDPQIPHDVALQIAGWHRDGLRAGRHDIKQSNSRWKILSGDDHSVPQALPLVREFVTDVLGA